MFLFNRVKKNEETFDPDCKISFFGNLFRIKVINEMEGNEEATKGIENKAIALLKKKTNDIQKEMEKYIQNNYLDIIEEYYLELDYSSLKGSEYQECLQLKEDYNNNTSIHTDIVIKNIKPVYFSITGEDSSYLFLYINSSDGYGMDIELHPQIIIHKHE